jgi:hypothetical protein
MSFLFRNGDFVTANKIIQDDLVEEEVKDTIVTYLKFISDTTENSFAYKLLSFNASRSNKKELKEEISNDIKNSYSSI